jgi:hypothetical protein
MTGNLMIGKLTLTIKLSSGRYGSIEVSHGVGTILSAAQPNSTIRRLVGCCKINYPVVQAFARSLPEGD